jgi:hypothetical protein
LFFYVDYLGFQLYEKVPLVTLHSYVFVKNSN